MEKSENGTCNCTVIGDETYISHFYRQEEFGDNVCGSVLNSLDSLGADKCLQPEFAQDTGTSALPTAVTVINNLRYSLHQHKNNTIRNINYKQILENIDLNTINTRKLRLPSQNILLQ